MSPLISIIVPTYNQANTIQTCIDSILSQSYPNFEVIIVNDGSTDLTSEICQRYAERDRRICYLSKKNGGLSSTRNYGLAHSNGELICFVDSDDYVEGDMLETLHSLSSDFAICSHYGEGCWSLNLKATVSTCDSDSIYLLVNSNAISTTWSKLYKRDIICRNNMSFNEDLHRSEDVMFNLEYLSYCNTFAVSSDKKYYYSGEWGAEGGRYNISVEEYVLLKTIQYDLKKKIYDKTGVTISWINDDIHCLYKIYQRKENGIPLIKFLNNQYRGKVCTSNSLLITILQIIISLRMTFFADIIMKTYTHFCYGRRSHC